jgi:hypothetical protein
MYTGENRPIAEKQRQKRPMKEKKSWDINLIGLLEPCLELISAFKEASRNIIFIFCYLKRHPVNFKSISACIEITDLIVEGLNKYLSGNPVSILNPILHSWFMDKA